MIFQIDKVAVEFKRLQFQEIEWHVLQLQIDKNDDCNNLHARMTDALQSFEFDTRFSPDEIEAGLDDEFSHDIRIINGLEIPVIHALESRGMTVDQVG